MNILNTYFDTLVFYYIEEKKGLAVYVASVAGMLGGDKMRCVIAFVPVHLGIVDKAKLKDLPWVNLQMRICPKGTYKTVAQKWKAPVNNCEIPDITLAVIDRDKTYSKCVSTSPSVYFPFDVLMIHSPKKNTIYQYPNTMNLHWAIDQFNTVFNLQKEIELYPKTEDQTSFTNTNNIEWI
jgi:hypothetical protein